METLNVADVVQVEPEDYLSREFDVPVFCQIGPQHYTRHSAGKGFNFRHFLRFPAEYESDFLKYAMTTDILIAGHYWDPRSPNFFSALDMQKPEFRIKIISDISCDVPGPIPSTLRSTTISDPFYDYNPHLGSEEPAFSQQSNITMMSIDNLPGELPRDASQDFGRMLISNVLPDILLGKGNSMIDRATILKDGNLMSRFSYLVDFMKF